MPRKFCGTHNWALANFALRIIRPSKFCGNTQPRGPQAGPRWAQNGPTMARDGSKVAARCVKIAHDGPKDTTNSSSGNSHSRAIPQTQGFAATKHEFFKIVTAIGGREVEVSPRKTQERPTWPQDSPRWLQIGPTMGPRWPQDGPKMFPRWPRWPILKICPGAGKFCMTRNLPQQILCYAKFALANFALRKICPSKFGITQNLPQQICVTQNWP